jgi:hypothetical protein
MRFPFEFGPLKNLSFVDLVLEKHWGSIESLNSAVGRVNVGSGPNAPTKSAFQDFMRQLGLGTDVELTAAARALEPNWKPEVFRRMR